jgi:hypothetical protein
MAKKATYQDAFDKLAPTLTKPASGADTMNSPNLTKGGITISKDLIPDDVAVGDVVLMKVASVDLDKNEVSFEYLNKQESTGTTPAATPSANLNTL